MLVFAFIESTSGHSPSLLNVEICQTFAFETRSKSLLLLLLSTSTLSAYIVSEAVTVASVMLNADRTCSH